MARKIKKGDTVIVLSGKDKNKEGVVQQVFPEENKLIVSGINVVRDNIKPSQANPNGGVVNKLMPMHQSKVALKDGLTGKPTRVGFITVDGVKYRIAKKSKERLNAVSKLDKNKVQK